MNKLISLFLLVVMSFSIAHGVVLDTHDEESHCSVQEYVAEFSAPIHNDDAHEHENDACDSHYIFHVSFLLPESFSLFEMNQEVFVVQTQPLKNHYAYQKNSFRPPIV
jgi:hypothetical protein